MTPRFSAGLSSSIQYANTPSHRTPLRVQSHHTSEPSIGTDWKGTRTT